MNKSFIPYELQHGLIADMSDDEFPTEVWGFYASDDEDELELADNATHFGYVYSGELTVESYARPDYDIYDYMYFSIPGEARIYATENCRAIIISRLGYSGMFSIGGPIEPTGRLRYVSGCTDSLLIPPVMKGDPCLNALYFPPHIEQVPHTHPSMRVGIVVSGKGEFVTPEGVTTLEPGMVFVIPANSLHCFKIDESAMSFITYHPDSAYGPTHENHSMLLQTNICPAV